PSLILRHTPPPPRSTLSPYTTLFRSLDKGFGLGTTSDVRWASTNLSDVVFTQPTTTQLLTAAVLRQVIGPTAFDRLAAHAITLGDRKSTRLNSSHLGISYAVFCLKKK